MCAFFLCRQTQTFPTFPPFTTGSTYGEPDCCYDTCCLRPDQPECGEDAERRCREAATCPSRAAAAPAPAPAHRRHRLGGAAQSAPETLPGGQGARESRETAAAAPAAVRRQRDSAAGGGGAAGGRRPRAAGVCRPAQDQNERCARQCYVAVRASRGSPCFQRRGAARCGAVWRFVAQWGPVPRCYPGESGTIDRRQAPPTRPTAAHRRRDNTLSFQMYFNACCNN